ncbi:unnamed protein product [Clonostachys rhizophaga]|uniref:Uncharacterized protein n=1 Tax=Clonostachys rhizophaga TaxID=160324 RepID=A0A9N9YFY2_9HYPO|nr:unnamed protein product [Clonostachys rhizophaga]
MVFSGQLPFIAAVLLSIASKTSGLPLTTGRLATRIESSNSVVDFLLARDNEPNIKARNDNAHGTFHKRAVVKAAPKKPAVVEKFAPKKHTATKKPAAAKKPAVVKSSVLRKPAAAKKPAAPKKHAAPEKPAAAKKPAVVKSSVLRKPGDAKKPIAIQNPAAPKKPIDVSSKSSLCRRSDCAGTSGGSGSGSSKDNKGPSKIETTKEMIDRAAQAAQNKRGKATPAQPAPQPAPVNNPGPFPFQVNTDTDPGFRADRIVSVIDAYADDGKVTYPKPNSGQ